ncbi:MAG: DUF2927 domain-containing protein [Pseudomonadota bacterium]
MEQKLLNALLICLLATSLVGYLIANRKGFCTRLFDADFEQDFEYMTTTAEDCTDRANGCTTNLSYWAAPINLQFVSEDADSAKFRSIVEITLEAFAEIQTVSPIVVSPFPSEESNYFIYAMNEDMLRVLVGDPDDIFGFKQGSLHRMSYESQGCSARVFFANEDVGNGQVNYSKIEFATVFIHEAREGFELQSCIFEEVAGSVGLLNDPEGSPSLFSEGGYTWDGTSFSYSKRTLSWIEAIYAITGGKVENVQEYCEFASS